MKTPEDILQTLGGLSGGDREWILQRLSPQARKSLLDGAIEQAVTAPEPIGFDSPERDELATIRSARPEQLAAILADEPAWVIHCAIFIVDASTASAFKDALLGHLNVAVRARVERLQSSRVRYPSAVQAHVRTGIVKALKSISPIAVSETSAVSFWSFALRKLSERLSTRRLRMST